MAKNIPSNEKQRHTTKTTLPNKALNQDRRPNKGFPREKKSKRIYLHQTSSARHAKGAAVSKGRKREKESVMNKYLLIITLNLDGLNALIKRHRIVEWIRKHDPHICCLQETHLRIKDLHRLKVKGWTQIFQAKGQEKKAGVAIIISDKIDFKKTAIKRDPEGHFIILKRRIHQEDITIVNIYAPNIGTPKYIKKILEDFKKDIDSKQL